MNMKAYAVSLARPVARVGLGGLQQAPVALGMALSLCLTLGCSDDDEEPPAIVTDSGSVTVLASNMDVPTTAAVRGGNAWVPQGQFDHLPGMANMGTAPGPFVVSGVNLSTGSAAGSISLPADFFPEGIAADPDTGDLYVGSITTGAIVKVNAGSTTQAAWLAAGVLTRAAVGLFVDKERDLLWACDSSLAAMGATLVGIGLDDKAVKVRHDLSATGFCNDIVVDTDGTVYVTETFGGSVYKIEADEALTANSAESWLTVPAIAPPMGGFGANGITILGQRMVIANTSTPQLVLVDYKASNPGSTAEVISLTRNGTAYTPSGPDGLTKLSETELLVVENGFAAPNLPQVSKVTLDTE
jgi:sugar lactone lactonase YvrE